MRCPACRTEHRLEEGCGVTRRSFFFIGGGAALGAALAPAAKMWEPYRVKCPMVGCRRDIITHSREVVEHVKHNMPISTWWNSDGVVTVSPLTAFTSDPHLIELKRRRFTGTRNWLGGLV